MFAVALGHQLLLRGTNIGECQHHIGRFIGQMDIAHDGACETRTNESTGDGGKSTATRVGILGDEIGYEHVVRSLHLAMTHIRALPQLAAACQCALLLRDVEALVAVEEREAVRLHNVDLNHALGEGILSGVQKFCDGAYTARVPCFAVQCLSCACLVARWLRRSAGGVNLDGRFD